MSNLLPRFEELKYVHIIGACGTLMGSFAAFLKRRGIRVTGSDQNIYPPMSDVLARAGVELFSGYSAENLTKAGVRPDLVVVGNVISSGNVEARAAIDGGYAYTSLPEAMEKIMLGETLNCVVAGTHGKTTTSSLLAHVLTCCKKDPSYFIGGVPVDLPNSFHISNINAGQCFVLEGDEYDTAFWDKVPKFNHYLPDRVILTSVEYDHADIYPDFESVKNAFAGLVSRVRAGGSIVACYDYDAVRELVAGAQVKVLSYSSQVNVHARFTPASITQKNGKICFHILDEGKKVAEIELQIPGLHNVMNAISVWILSTQLLGLSTEEVSLALASFRGVKRRQEVRGTVRGVMVIDDFAHHPTAVRETLNALKGHYSDRRLIAVFEPRSATSRRKVFQAQYAEAFDSAEAVLIASPFDQSKIASDNQFSSDQLVSDIQTRWRSKGRAAEVHLFSEIEQGVASIVHQAKPGDLVAVLSNGGFGGLIPKLLEELSK